MEGSPNEVVVKISDCVVMCGDVNASRMLEREMVMVYGLWFMVYGLGLRGRG